MTLRNHHDATHDCDAIIELIPDYAFGLTSAEENNLVEKNLPYCPDAAAQLADFRNLQGEMRAGVPQMDAPAHLEARLMAAIATPAPAVPAAPRPRVLPLAWMAAAAVLAILLLTNLYWLNRVDDLTRRQEELMALLATDDISVRATPETAFILTSTSDLRWVRLPPSQATNTNASAFLMWNAESEIGLLYVANFPQLPQGRTYQLWLTRGEERLSAGTFEVDETGKGVLLFHITEPIDEYAWSRITEEPWNGSDQPGDHVLVNGELVIGD